MIQALEGRLLLAGVDMSHGTLRITCQSSGGAVVVTEDAAGRMLTVSTGGRESNLALAKVRRIRVIGGAGADTVTLGADGAPITVGMKVFGKDGNDVVTCFAGTKVHVVLDGGAGDDTLTCNAAGPSHPAQARILGGPGKDALKGGIGHDRIEGGDGDDEIDGGGGVDQLFGGKGFDEIRVEPRPTVIRLGPGHGLITSAG